MKNKLIPLIIIFFTLSITANTEFASYNSFFLDSSSNVLYEYIQNHQLENNSIITENFSGERVLAIQLCVDEYEKESHLPKELKSLKYYNFSVLKKDSREVIVHFYQNYDKILRDSKNIYFGLSAWCLIDIENEKVLDIFKEK